MFKVEPLKPKKQRVSLDNVTYLWQLSLSHITLNKIERLAKDKLLSELKDHLLLV